jgi:hypothetical protein
VFTTVSEKLHSPISVQQVFSETLVITHGLQQVRLKTVNLPLLYLCRINKNRKKPGKYEIRKYENQE